MSVPGGAVTWGTRLPAGCGLDRDRCDRAQAVQAWAGTSPVLDPSGKLRRVLMHRACDKHFRAAVHPLAFTSLLRCAWARDDDDPYRARGHGHHAAWRALANVWLRIRFRMGKTRQPSAEAQFLAARAARGLTGDGF